MKTRLVIDLVSTTKGVNRKLALEGVKIAQEN
jgi:hypothetical protein